MLKVLSKREKYIFIFALGVIIFSLVFNFMILPLANKYRDLSDQTKIAKMRLEKYYQLLAQKEKIQKHFDQASGVYKFSGKPESGLVEILGELENLAKGANIRLIDIRPEISRSKGISVDLRAEGKMEDYLKFIYGIENSLYILNIKRLQINSRPNSPDLEGSFSIIQNPLN